MTSASTGLPAQQCSATAKSTGERCRQRITGASVCRMHGGAAPQVAAKRAERIALAEAASRTPHEHPGALLLQAVHYGHVYAQQLADDGNTDAEKLLDAWERVARLSETALRLDASQRGQDVIEREADRIFALLEAISRSLQAELVSLLTVHAPTALDVLDGRWEGIFGEVARKHLGEQHERTVRELEDGRG